MHYIQNSWFSHNWMWVFTFLILLITVIAYMNNRKGLMKKAVAVLGLFFVMAVGSSAFYYQQKQTLIRPAMELQQAQTNDDAIQNGTMLQSLSNAVWKILSDKVSE